MNEPDLDRGLVSLAIRSAQLAAVLAFVQWVVHPLLSGGSLRTWSLYWLYTFFGVLLPGILVAVRAIRRRSDWLTWFSIGWTLGHAIELASFLLARQIGEGRWFLIWVPIAYAYAYLGRSNSAARVERVDRPLATAASLVLIILSSVAFYVLLNSPEVSSIPPYQSDVWFHVNNAHEFRDHTPMQDPRVAGEPMNYHVFAYASPAAVSLITGEAVAPILLRYSGASWVWMVGFGLFVVGREFGRGRVGAGFLAAALVLFPIEVWTFFAGQMEFGASLPLNGVYLSTTTLAGHAFFTSVLLLTFWHYRGMSRPGMAALVLLIFAAAGSKAMIGPVILCGALGAAAWHSVVQPEWTRATRILLVLAALGVLPVLYPLLLAEDSYAQAIRWVFAEYAGTLPYHRALTSVGVPDAAARSLWIFGFATLPLVGAVLATPLMRTNTECTPYLTFVWMAFFASLVPSVSIGLRGTSQLFFLYYGIASLATIAGTGWIALAHSPYRSRVAWGIFSLWVAVQLLFGLPATTRTISSNAEIDLGRVGWWTHLGREAPRNGRELRRLGVMSMTPSIGDGLDFARRTLPADAVFATNVFEAAPFAALSESRAFFETVNLHVSAHLGNKTDNGRFEARLHVVRDWIEAKPHSCGALLAGGVTHLFIDRVNGVDLSAASGFGRAIYQSDDFEVRDLTRTQCDGAHASSGSP